MIVALDGGDQQGASYLNKIIEKQELMKSGGVHAVANRPIPMERGCTFSALP